MLISRALRLLCALALVACGEGCFGGQGTDESGRCRHARSELGGDEQVAPALGFAPSDVLSWAAGARSVRARWNEPPSGTTTSSRPGPVELVVAIERTPAAALEVIADPWCGGRPHLSVPVVVTVQSADRQLDERWTSALTASRADFAQVTAEVDLERLRGAFTWRSVTPRVGLVQPTLTLVMTRTDSAGSFGAGVETRTASSLSVGPGGSGRVLTWPADSPCGSEYVARAPLEPDAVYVAAMANAATSVWSDARGTEHALTITGADLLCESEQGEPALRTNVTLRSADGLFDVTLEAWFVRNGERLEYDRSRARGLEGSPTTFVERFGDFGLDLSGYEHVSLALELTLSASGGQADFAVVGYRDECQASCDARGCSGCGPLARTTLRALSLSQRP